MRAICVDDEYLLLRTLKNVVIQSPDIEQAVAFNDEHDALEWARDNDFDIAFIDIELHDMNGLELAKALHEIRSNARIVFCTGFTNYAVDAISLHMDVGYVMKPIEYESIQREIDHIKTVVNTEKYLLTVRCYGGFEVYDKSGVPLYFKRKRSKELLALLVDRNGMSMSAKDICAVMFEDDGQHDQKNMNHFYKIYYGLAKTLEEAEAQGVLLKNGSTYYVNMSLIYQDDTGKGSRSYMEEYSWSEGHSQDQVKR